MAESLSNVDAVSLSNVASKNFVQNRCNKEPAGNAALAAAGGRAPGWFRLRLQKNGVRGMGPSRDNQRRHSTPNTTLGQLQSISTTGGGILQRRPSIPTSIDRLDDTHSILSDVTWFTNSELYTAEKADLVKDEFIHRLQQQGDKVRQLMEEAEKKKMTQKEEDLKDFFRRFNVQMLKKEEGHNEHRLSQPDDGNDDADRVETLLAGMMGVQTSNIPNDNKTGQAAAKAKRGDDRLRVSLTNRFRLNQRNDSKKELKSAEFTQQRKLPSFGSIGSNKHRNSRQSGSWGDDKPRASMCNLRLIQRKDSNKNMKSAAFALQRNLPSFGSVGMKNRTSEQASHYLNEGNDSKNKLKNAAFAQQPRLTSFGSIRLTKHRNFEQNSSWEGDDKPRTGLANLRLDHKNDSKKELKSVASQQRKLPSFGSIGDIKHRNNSEQNSRWGKHAKPRASLTNLFRLDQKNDSKIISFSSMGTLKHHNSSEQNSRQKGLVESQRNCSRAARDNSNGSMQEAVKNGVVEDQATANFHVDVAKLCKPSSNKSEGARADNPAFRYQEGGSPREAQEIVQKAINSSLHDTVSPLASGDDNTRIEDDIDIKSLVANQQATIDALSSKLHNLEVAHRNHFESLESQLKECRSNFQKEQQLLKGRNSDLARENAELRRALREFRPTRRYGGGGLSDHRVSSVSSSVAVGGVDGYQGIGANGSRNRGGIIQSVIMAPQATAGSIGDKSISIKTW